MKHPRPKTLAAALCLTTALAYLQVWDAWAIAGRPATTAAGEADAFSPLFARRLEVGQQNMDKPSNRVFMAGMRYTVGEPVGTPLSANPVSTCLASGCFGSACLGSACLLSACIGSACANSKCVGSGCIVSVCGGSACVTSGCVGSVCTGSACVGSVCVATACLGSACTQCSGPEPAGEPERG